VFSESDGVVRRLHTVVTCAALLMFAWLTVRHVGESAFLEDQVDQLQNFESLLRLRPEGLWGAEYPPSKTIGQSLYLRELVLPPGIARYRRSR
jgi:hypothetical protein